MYLYTYLTVSHLLKLSSCTTQSRALWNSSVRPMSHRVSSESTMVAPRPPKLFLPARHTSPVRRLSLRAITTSKVPARLWRAGHRTPL